MTAPVERLYALLDDLAARTGGPKELRACGGRLPWPQRGIYFFFEPGEIRPDGRLRVVRVGTHALRAGSRSTLWGRLSQHRGNLAGSNPGGGNHRGSIFRLHVGEALLARDGDPAGLAQTWGRGTNATPEIRAREAEHECRVSAHIGSMPFLWVGIDDEPGPLSDRGLIERSTIAMLSCALTDPPSPTWLGHWANRPVIRSSGLWNVNHIGERPDPAALDRLEYWISKN